MPQKTLPPNKITILVDYREVESDVVRELKKQDCTLSFSLLRVADYLLSDRVAVERKRVRDFLQSILDQRLFRQAKSLLSYASPVIIMEGDPYELYSTDINENAIRGALASLSVDYRVPIIWSRNSGDTAAILYRMAKREQEKEKRPLVIRGEQKPQTLHEQQEYLVAGLPGISTKLSKLLLRHFGCPGGVFNASEDELQRVHGIGKITAKRIRRIIEHVYTSGG
jgi:Fanconi anemia group M protein